jgi:transcriptional regulator with XRE-family HTH domain
LSELGSEIRRLREEHGWTQNQLSVYAGVSQPTVNQIETGKRNPSTATVVKVAEALGVGASDLFPKAPAPSPELPFNGLEDEQREGMPDTPIVKPSVASAHVQTTATAKMLVEVLEDIEQGRTEEAAAKLRQLIAA